MQVELDNSDVVDMPDGFPSPPRRQDGGFVIILRFPRFNSSAFYDPAVDTTDEQASYDNSTTTDGTATTTTNDDIVPTTSSRMERPRPSSILVLGTGLLLALTADTFAL